MHLCITGLSETRAVFNNGKIWATRKGHLKGFKLQVRLLPFPLDLDIGP